MTPAAPAVILPIFPAPSYPIPATMLLSPADVGGCGTPTSACLGARGCSIWLAPISKSRPGSGPNSPAPLPCWRPNVKSGREQDVAALGKLRDLLQGDVGVAAQVLKALVGDVVIETRQIEGQEKLQMVARFTISAVPALAVLDRGGACGSEGSSWPVACSQQPAESTGRASPTEVVVPLNRKCHRSSGDLPVTSPADAQPPQA